MIIVNIACGLANRMFQYCYYLYLKKLGYDVAVDFYRTVTLAHENVAWNSIFPNAPIHQASVWEVFKTGGGSGIVSKIRRRYFPFICKVKSLSAFEAPLPEQNGHSVYMIGVFQNAKMVETVHDEVAEAFAFSPFVDGHNLTLAEEMQSCQSVAIHVRKGKDYMSRIWYTNTCPVEYYRKAVEMMKEKMDNPRFYVFTDNPEWVKDNFVDFEYMLVQGNPVSGYGSHFDMQLMSLCKHNIISNSTYSWWGAYLNPHQDKIVIAPNIWFNPDSCADYTSQQLLCDGWIAL